MIGRPNVGKSSLVNALLGEERVIVSDIAGTTRDAIDTPYEYEGQKYKIIDTAGMRKKGKVYETTEKYSALRALKAIDRSDVVLIVLTVKKVYVSRTSVLRAMQKKLERRHVCCEQMGCN